MEHWGVLPGVEAVATDIPTKSVHVRFDSSQLSMEQIEQLLMMSAMLLPKHN